MDKDWQLITRLHESLTSVVYRGRLGDTPAIFKLLKREFSEGAELARFQFEYETAAGLTSDYIVRPLARGEIDGIPAHAYEDIGGESLGKLAAGHPLAVADVLFIGHAVAKGLVEVHRQKLFHKDINPHNVVVNLQTRRVQIIDFGISTRLSREAQDAPNPERLEGTLRYMSPEQTGRMNRSVDYRTDFYSLGALLYELLSGRAPLEGKDATESVHLILAAAPAPLTRLRPDLPGVVAELVMRLLAKAPEDRYQSAFGLAHDLATCLAEFGAAADVAPFPLGRQDQSDRFEMSEALYGRERDVGELCARWEAAAAGANELVLIEGPSGIGKSALVQQLKKPLVAHRGQFISGKFDQFKRNVPYFAITPAFNQLVQRILTQSPEAVARWKEQILAALGNVGGTLVELVPALELLIGPQPPPPRLEPEQSKHRLRRVLERFVRVVATADHPLVVFLDDLQWADGSSLDVLALLAAADGPRHLLVIVAYRDNEVTPSHPAALALQKLREAGAALTTLRVEPLAPEAIGRFLADTLKCPAAAVAGLTELVAAKTHGNPFFIRTFLQVLVEKGLVAYDYAERRWAWSATRIATQKITDNVVELLVEKMAELASETRRALTHAACIGPSFDLKTLALLLETPPQAAAAALWPAIAEGFVIPASGDFKYLLTAAGQAAPAAAWDAARTGFVFAHDRVQQAAHSLLPADQRAQMHYHMGGILAASLSEAEQKDRVFEIVDHFNFGCALATGAAERERLARLNVLAGNQAQSASAYGSAAAYYLTARGLLGEGAWAAAYDLARQVWMGLARSYHAIGQFDDGFHALTEALPALRTPIDKANAYELMGSMHEARSQHAACVTACLKGMALLGIALDPHVSYLRLGYEALKLRLLYKNSLIAFLSGEQRPSDERWQALLTLANRAMPSAYLSNTNLYVVLSLKIFRTAQREGVRLDHPTFTIVLSQVLMVLKARKDALRLRDLGYAQLGARRDVPLEALFHCLTGHWCDVVDKPLAECVAIEERAYEKAMESGDLGNAGVAAFFIFLNTLGGGYTLAEIGRKADLYRHFFLKNPHNYSYSLFHSVVQTARSFAGQTTAPDAMTDEAVSEADILARAKETSGTLALHTFTKTWLEFHTGQYASALKRALRNPLQIALPGCFSGALNLAILAISALRLRQAKTRGLPGPLVWVLVTLAGLELAWWDRTYRFVARGLADLVRAEALRTRGRTAAALAAYEVALGKFAEAKAYYWLCFCHEAAGRLYRAAGAHLPAAIHLHEAIQELRRFGAGPQAEALEAEVGEYLDRQLKLGRTPRAVGVTGSLSQATGAAAKHSLDLDSVVKATQAISGQMDLTKLVTDMLRIVMENAGATYGALLTAEDGRLAVRVTGRLNGAAFEPAFVAPGLGATPAAHAAASVVQYVERTRLELILNTAAAQEDYAHDPYVVARRPKSITCLPVVAQGELVAVLYLENDLLANAFTQTRLRTLRILAAQGAISLRNAEFVRDLRASTERTRALKGQLEKILAGTKDMAASQAAEVAVGIALRTMTEEIPAFKGAYCSALIRDQLDQAYALWPVLADGRFDRASAADAAALARWQTHLGLTQTAAPDRSTVVVPISWQSETAGLLIFEGLEDVALSDEQRQFIETLASSLGLSLKNIDHQDHLGNLVRERTRALETALAEVVAKQQKIQAIMDHIDQGILTFDEHLAIEPEFSAYLPRLLREDALAIGRADVVATVFKNVALPADERQRIREVLAATLGWDELGWQLNGGSLPREVTLATGADERTLAVDWTPIYDAAGTVGKMMLTARDVTDHRRLERRVRLQDEELGRKMRALSRMLPVERGNLTAFFLDCRERMGDVQRLIASGAPPGERLFQQLHTLKGSSRSLKFTELATAVHEAEEVLQRLLAAQGKGRPPAPADAAELARLVDAAEGELAYLDAVFREVFGDSVAADGATWSLYSFASQVYPGIREQVTGQGLSLGKFEVNDLVGGWDQALRRQVQQMLGHALSNALDHGYFLPVREGAAPRPVEVEIWARRAAGGGIVLTVEDRGAGLSLAKIRVLAERIGRQDLLAAHPEEVLFQTGATTAAAATLTSGRGVGLGAIRATARSLGGEATIRARAGGGTVFEICIPGVAAVGEAA